MTTTRHMIGSLTLGLVLLAGSPSLACAQDMPAPALNLPDATTAEQLCITPEEVIITPHDHVFGIPAVWDATYAEDDRMVQFFAGLPMADNTIMAWGRTLSKDGFKPENMLLVELNRRSRAVNLKKKPARADELPTDLIAMGKGYVASSTYRAGETNAPRRRVRLSWYDAQAGFRFEKILQDDSYHYDSFGLVPATDGNGFVALIHASARHDDNDQHAVLIRFTAGGEQVWKRAFRTGAANLIRNIIPLPDDNYMAVGRMNTGTGMTAGWIAQLNPQGALIWQRTYDRGAYAILKHAAISPNSAPGSYNVFVFGDARPVDDGPDAVWLMEIDNRGDIIRQRYLRRDDFAFSAFGLNALADGRLQLAVNAQLSDDATPGVDMRDHIRLFTMTSQGVLMSDEAFIDGIAVRGRDFTTGWNGERIVIATIQSDSRPLPPSQELAAALLVDNADPANDRPPPAPDDVDHEGWVFVAPSLDPYTNPCMPAPVIPLADD